MGHVAETSPDDLGQHRLADPAEREADDGDAKLHAVDDFIQVAVQFLDDAGADAAGVDELLDPGLADADQRKLRGRKESVGRHQQQDQKYPQQHKSDH